MKHYLTQLFESGSSFTVTLETDDLRLNDRGILDVDELGIAVESNDDDGDDRGDAVLVPWRRIWYIVVRVSEDRRA